MANLLGTSLSGLLAAQRSIETTSHNISNVNTEGYSRQRAEQITKPAEFSGGGYVGTGVSVATVTRSYDQFITNQLLSSSAAFSEADSFANMASQVDNIVANESTGLSPALKTFFNSVNEVANYPSSIPVRQVMVSEAASLTQQFHTMSAQLENLGDQTNTQLQGIVNDINTYAKDIATLNVEIAYKSNRTSSEQLPNDLLDRRDFLISKIAEKVSVSTIPQQDGSLTVFIGNGQSLVLGANTNELSLAGSSTDYDQKNILMNGANITKQISGGELHGALKFRDEILQPAQHNLGLLAAGFAVEFNKIHTTGFDLNGVAGKEMFSLGTPNLAVPVISDPSASGTVSAVYDPANTGKLYPSDYRLSYDGTNYTLNRLSDNTVTTFSALPSATTITGPGFTLTTSTVAAGDSFLIRPTFAAAGKIETLISKPEELAAAGTNIPGPPVAPVPGDNTAALALAALEKKSVLENGKTTFSGAYGQMVAKIGTLTHAAKISSSAQGVLFNQAKQSRENVAGVNLDEEAANLIKFQNSYQAAAQAISVAQSLFDSLLGAVR